MSNEDFPRRRFRIVLDVQGDTEKELMSEFDCLVREVRHHGIECKVVQGGVGSSGHVVITEDPEMTHERYFAAVEAWRAKDPEGK